MCMVQACTQVSMKGETRRVPLIKGDFIQFTAGKFQDLHGIVTRLTAHQAYVVLDDNNDAPVVLLVDQHNLKIVVYSRRPSDALLQAKDEIRDLSNELDDMDFDQNQYDQLKQTEGKKLNELLNQDDDMAYHVRCIAKYVVQHDLTSAAAVSHVLEPALDYLQDIKQDPSIEFNLPADSIFSKHSSTHTFTGIPIKQEDMEM